MRKFTEFEKTEIKLRNRIFHGKFTDYSYKFRYYHCAKYRSTTPIKGEITGAGKNAIKIVLTAEAPAITGKKFGKPTERVVFSRVVKYWDFHPMNKRSRDPRDHEYWEWVRTHDTLGHYLNSLEAMLYGLTYGLGELNYCAHCMANGN